ncbi:hypothetical protein C8J56DRAFT_1131088 [Mycena floridula]|nr:hypothetical protein C8J56DRAFT_1131088 [Mycena floridula]
MHPILETHRDILTLLCLSINLASNLLPSNVVYIGTLAFGGTALLVSCIDRRLPHRTLPALQSLLNDIAHSVGLLADTDHGLKLRLAVQSLEDEISDCEIKYLRLSATPWSSYHRDFYDLVRSLRICTRESHALMITIKSRLEVERQQRSRSHIILHISEPAVLPRYLGTRVIRNMDRMDTYHV